VRYFFLIFLNIFLFAEGYHFEENKYVDALDSTFTKRGFIEVAEKEVHITYTAPQAKEIIKKNETVGIKGKSGKVYYLKGIALERTKQFIDIMIRLGAYKEIKNNEDFTITSTARGYSIAFSETLKKLFTKAEVETKADKVLRFKLFMKNNDTLEIVKR